MTQPLNLSAPLLAAGLVLGLALPAAAGGPVPAVPEPAPMPAPVPVMPTSEEWTGFSVGANLGYGQVAAPAGDSSGLLYGLDAAYDHDFGKWVVGAELSYDMADIGTGGDGLQGLARAGLRGGLDLGRTFVYLTGGAARAMESTAGDTTMANGWYAGVGAKRQLTGNWDMQGELLTNRFGNIDGGGGDMRATTLSLGVSFGF